MRALHDMRIAAKRLRYVLEADRRRASAPTPPPAAKRAKELQDLLGEIHDCDEMLPRVRALGRAGCEVADASAPARRAAPADDLDPALAAATPHAPTPTRACRRSPSTCRPAASCSSSASCELWAELEREGFRARLEYALRERPVAGRDNVAVTGC